MDQSIVPLVPLLLEKPRHLRLDIATTVSVSDGK